MWRRANVSEGARMSGCTGGPYRARMTMKTPGPVCWPAEHRGRSGKNAEVALRKIGQLHRRRAALGAGQPRRPQLAQRLGVGVRVDEHRALEPARAADITGMER